MNVHKQLSTVEMIKPLGALRVEGIQRGDYVQHSTVNSGRQYDRQYRLDVVSSIFLCLLSPARDATNFPSWTSGSSLECTADLLDVRQNRPRTGSVSDHV